MLYQHNVYCRTQLASRAIDVVSLLQVFIYEGKIHIIPPPETPAELTFLPRTLPSVQEAILCIREHQEVTMASEKIQRDISGRTGE